MIPEFPGNSTAGGPIAIPAQADSGDSKWRTAVYSKILMLRFPRTEVEKPIVCHLARDYDLTFNILNATVLPRKEGVMVLELSGTRKNFKEGVKYLKSSGVQVQNAEQEVRRIKDRCTDCGACTAVCPTGALSVRRPEMSVRFEQKKCSVCELCVPACPTRAMEVRPTNGAFFE
jgi:L-aspartate semialdehyde sulfurtransferase ferredoxin